MADQVKIKLISHVSEVNAKVQDAIDRALETCGGKAESYAKQLCPVQTGNLRGSISHRQRDKKSEIIGTNVKYAPYVEYGHHQQPGRYVPAIGKRLKRSYVPGKPFIVPAVENHKDEYQKVFNNELSKVK